MALDQVPHDIVFDRCYLHGDPLRGTRRGIAMNSAATAVVDSYLSDFKEADTDAQAIAGWNGPGPFRIENNYLEAATENVMFGGADPTIRDLVPADIVLRRNHFKKPLSWREHLSAPGKSGWSVKNLFELKNARRVLIDGNLFEYSWGGFAILFTVRNQNGSAPWSTVEDVTFVHNVVRHSGGAINMHGTDNERPSQKTARVLIANNLFEDIDGARWAGKGRFVQILAGARDVVVEHNTALQDGAAVFAEGEAFSGFVFRNNLLPHGDGIAGTDHAPGRDTLQHYFPGSVVESNVMWGNSEMERVYPEGNFFPDSPVEVGFAAAAQGDYRLSERSPYRRRAADGKDIGADFDTLSAALSTATSR
jgi:predicted outer membrane repeat protein